MDSYNELVGLMAVYLLLFTLIGVCAIFASHRCKKERRRLEKVLHDYNNAFKDDYKPF